MQRFKATTYNLQEETVIEFSKNKFSRGIEIGGIQSGNNATVVCVYIDIDFIHESNSNFIKIAEEDFNSLNSGDIILFKPNGIVQVLFYKHQNDNALFLTNNCNNACLICSQPPLYTDDFTYFYLLNTAIIELLSDSPNTIGITGGEPTLLGYGLISLIEKISDKFPLTNIQILSNGRKFNDLFYTESISKIKLDNLLICIPLHSDYYSDHDKISGIIGSYNETLKGLYNLFRFNINVEIRIVINRLNYKRLNQMANYIFKNLPNASHIAFMGMEYTGFAVKNSNELLIFAEDYQNELEEAVLYLSSWGMNVSIYNIPLCLLKPSLYKYSNKSISNWKIKYFKECLGCLQKDNCGGSFNTSKFHSDKIRAITI